MCVSVRACMFLYDTINTRDRAAISLKNAFMAQKKTNPYTRGTPTHTYTYTNAHTRTHSTLTVMTCFVKHSECSKYTIINSSFVMY